MRRLAGLLICVALVFAPWCWGCAWPLGIHQLDLFLLTATICWLPSMLGRRDRLPRILTSAVCALLLQGWPMALNSRAVYAETTGLFAPIEQAVQYLPGSKERDLSWEAMTQLTAILGAALVSCALGRERVWRMRFIMVIIATAISIVFLGCAQRWTGATDIFWNSSRKLDYFFASYRNVTNAGEYLNLALPLAAAAARNAQMRGSLRQTGTVCALAILAAGSLVCGSKAAPLLSCAVGLAFFGAIAREMGTRGGIIVALVFTFAIGSIAWGAGLGVSQDRWHRLLAANGEVTLTSRLEVDRSCVRGVASSPWLGQGPGTFPAIFPRLQANGQQPGGRWLAAHNDYLQTALEWGFVGAIGWSIYLFGSARQLAHGLWRAHWKSEDVVWAWGVFLALAGAATMALIDFPLQVASLRLEVAVLVGLGWSSFSWPRSKCKEA